MRITAVRTIGVLARVHLGIDDGPLNTRPLCGAGPTRRTRTTAIRAANCRACIKLAQQAALNIEGLIEIPERIQRLINAVRVRAPEAAGFTNTELAGMFRPCRTLACALAKLTGKS